MPVTLQQEINITSKIDMQGLSINWESLVFSLRHPEIKILELVYVPEPNPVTMQRIKMIFRKLNYSERTARRKVEKLTHLGLIRTINSMILIINPVLPIQENVIKLIRQCKIRQGL